MRELSRLLYLSSSSEMLSEDHLREILDQSRKNNEKLGITGVLCVGGGHFIQVLEGNECDLIRLYSRIIDDPRHHDSVLIGIAPIRARMFQQWSMGYIQKSLEAMSDRRAQLFEYRSRHDQGDELVRIMQRFLNNA
jgi:hypothetical protein